MRAAPRTVIAQKYRFTWHAIAVTSGLFVGVAVIQMAWPEIVVKGHAYAVDGDTVRLSGRTIRLAGVDSPEMSQTCSDHNDRTYACGEVARDYLKAIVKDGLVTCRGRGSDRYGRLLARCEVAGHDINAQIVAAGWARDEGPYATEQRAAQTAQRGIWQGKSIAPRQWRQTSDAAQRSPWPLLGWLFGR